MKVSKIILYSKKISIVSLMIQASIALGSESKDQVEASLPEAKQELRQDTKIISNSVSPVANGTPSQVSSENKDVNSNRSRLYDFESLSVLIGTVIGSGSYAKVYNGASQSSSSVTGLTLAQHVAIKRFKLTNSSDTNMKLTSINLPAIPPEIVGQIAGQVSAVVN